MTTYKTVAISDALKTKKMAAAIEEKANEMARDGWELVTFSTTPSGKAILMFRTEDETAVKTAAGADDEEPAQETAVEQQDAPEEPAADQDTAEVETAEAVDEAE